MLPLQRDRLLLIGTDKGLSVMDMYPVEWADGNDDKVGIIQKGPSEAQALAVWTGEAYDPFYSPFARRLIRPL